MGKFDIWENGMLQIGLSYREMREVETLHISVEVNEQVQDIARKITLWLRLYLTQRGEFLLQMALKCFLSESVEELVGERGKNKTDLTLANIFFGLGFGQRKVHPDIATFCVRLLVKISPGSLDKPCGHIFHNDWL